MPLVGGSVSLYPEEDEKIYCMDQNFKAGLKKANSAEVDLKTPDPVIHIMPGQEKLIAEKGYGGTIRLGAWPCKLQPGTRLAEAYAKYTKNKIVSERHRHRYEVNVAYKDRLREGGLVISGQSPDGELTEFVELPREVHPFYVATQAHPEFKSRPTKPHPLFAGLVKAALDHQQAR
jgi:CTP synthase